MEEPTNSIVEVVHAEVTNSFFRKQVVFPPKPKLGLVAKPVVRKVGRTMAGEPLEEPINIVSETQDRTRPTGTDSIGALVAIDSVAGI